MKFIGYESYMSWIITIGSCIINCTSQTPYRIAGLMYVSIVEYYGTDRETASIPIFIFMIVRCLGGPFCGILGENFSPENITIWGSLIAAIGFGGCFFAQNVAGLSIFLGIIFGIGMTGSNTLLPTIMKKYFNKNINSANGIAQAGSCLGAIFIPPVTVYLLDEYGLPGTFLIISALMLHAVPISLIIQKAGLVQDKIIATTKRNNKFIHQEKLHVNNQKSPLDLDTIISTSNRKYFPHSANGMSEQVHGNNCNFLDSGTQVSKQMSLNNQKIFPDSETKIPQQMYLNNPKPLPGSEDTNISWQTSIKNQKYLLYSGITMSEPSTILEFETENKYAQLVDPISVCKDVSIKADNRTNSCDPNEQPDCVKSNEDFDVSPAQNHPVFEKSCPININIGNTLNCKTDQLNHKIVIEPQDCNDEFNTANTSQTNLPSDVKEISSDSKLPNMAQDKQMITIAAVASVKNLPEASAISNESHNLKSNSKSKFSYLKVFLNPPFLIIMLSTALHNYVSVLVWTTMIDYSRDKGTPRYKEVYFLIMHPFSELIGRMSFGWVTDLGYLTITKYSMICFSLMGLTCGCVLWSSEFWTMMLGALTFAISSGAMTVVFLGMVFRFVPEEMQSMAIASRYTLTGPLIFTSAPLIGYFRENHGSYDGIYVLLIAICLFCAATMPLLNRFSPRGKKVVP